MKYEDVKSENDLKKAINFHKNEYKKAYKKFLKIDFKGTNKDFKSLTKLTVKAMNIMPSRTCLSYVNYHIDGWEMIKLYDEAVDEVIRLAMSLEENLDSKASKRLEEEIACTIRCSDEYHLYR